MSTFRVVTFGKYILGGGLGSWAKSFERGVEQGEVRMINGVLMYAYSVYRRPLRASEINWVPVDGSKNSSEGLREWLCK